MKSARRRLTRFHVSVNHPLYIVKVLQRFSHCQGDVQRLDLRACKCLSETPRRAGRSFDM